MNVIWQEIREQLELEKQRVTAEIRRYPAPIPACDVQFNDLMQQRATITRELGRLEATVKQAISGTDMLSLMDAFVESSLCLNAETKQAIGSRLHSVERLS